MSIKIEIYICVRHKYRTMKKATFLFFLFPFFLFSQNIIERVEPPQWWAGMHNAELQIMFYGKGIGNFRPSINYEGISIERIVSVENDNYLFIYLNIDKKVKSAEVPVNFKNSNGEIVAQYKYPILSRKRGAGKIKGYDNSDVMCLITPDRFSNGDPENDNVEGMLEKVNRLDKDGRHGGDIKGIINMLDYLSEMGFTAIWLNPILENNQPKYSYHGYSTTDYYKVDSRFGTNEEYKKLADECRRKGIKLVMDMIMNHCGSEHWWMKDLPSDDWINAHDNIFYTSHERTTLRDPYASDFDRVHFSDGWFVKTMPDLNQRNPLLADYLIQNTIWWIEYLGLAGIRMDTYPYSDKYFMTEWTCTVMDEYPDFNICGEEWSLNPIILAYWQKGKMNPDGYTSCLPGLLDFPLQNAIVKSLTEKPEWGSDMKVIYEMLSNDFIYPEPFKHVIFPDNHDMSRIHTQLNEDADLTKITMTFFATMRGTPQYYYGAEILMSNRGDNSHGNIRSDFPGGWEGDEINAVNGKGLTKEQLEFQAYVRKLLNWRKTATAIHNGKLMHFAPKGGAYVYFRYNDEQKIMVVLNKSSESEELNLRQFAEILKGDSMGKNIMSGEKIKLENILTVGPRQALVLEVE